MGNIPSDGYGLEMRERGRALQRKLSNGMEVRDLAAEVSMQGL